MNFPCEENSKFHSKKLLKIFDKKKIDFCQKKKNKTKQKKNKTEKFF